MSLDAAVELESLSHRYAERLALDSVSFAVASGSVFSLLGPNGSGKSTLFRILTTLLTPTGGTAKICGLDVGADRAQVRRRIGVVFQSPSLDGKLTVLENLRTQGHLYGLSGRPLVARMGELLDRFGLGDRKGDFVDTLSGGLKRRVELAKALLHEPEVLILDEPSTGLDPAARATLMDQLHRLRDQEGVTTLLTTHLMDEADRCDRIAVLDEGRLIALDGPAELKQTVGGEVLTVSCADPAKLAASAKRDFSIDAVVDANTVRIEHETGHAFVPKLIEAYPGEIESVTVGRPTLDDVFLHLTGHRLWNDDKSSEGEAS